MNYVSYMSEIEEVFVRRRGRALFLSPRDWALMEEWEKKGIPLHIVIRSVNAVFDTYDKLPAGTRQISTLGYCKSEVEAQFIEWRASQVGKSGDEQPDSSKLTIESIAGYIDRSIQTLNGIARPELVDHIAQATAKLTKLRETLTLDFSAVDADLISIEKDLELAILTTLAADDAARLELQVDQQLATYKAGMDPEVYSNTHSLMFLKLLREQSGIPRLSLFHL